jgi:hypothetical protein
MQLALLSVIDARSNLAASLFSALSGKRETDIRIGPKRKTVFATGEMVFKASTPPARRVNFEPHSAPMRKSLLKRFRFRLFDQ